MRTPKEVKTVDVPDIALEYIAKLITEGYTSGRADTDGVCVSWSIDIEAWKES